MPLTDWTTLHGDAFAGTRALVTGGAGFIGSHLCEALTTLGADVVVLDDLSGTGGSWANLEGFFHGRKIQASVLEPDALTDATGGCGLVFHQAAMGSVPQSVEQPQLCQRINVEGTLNVLEAARAAQTRRVVFAASSSAYGDAPGLPKSETMPALPLSPYAASKVAGEALVRAYAASYEQIDGASLRYFNIFGPRQNANSAYAAVIAAFAQALLDDDRPAIYGDGEQSRDFTHVDNVVHANLLAARHADPLGGAVYNIGCAKRITVNQLAAGMTKTLGKPHLIPQHLPERPGDVKHSLADLAAARESLGYDPVVGFDAGLADTVAWYAAQNSTSTP